jgi:hypothetical protein
MEDIQGEEGDLALEIGFEPEVSVAPNALARDAINGINFLNRMIPGGLSVMPHEVVRRGNE